MISFVLFQSRKAIVILLAGGWAVPLHGYNKKLLFDDHHLLMNYWCGCVFQIFHTGVEMRLFTI